MPEPTDEQGAAGVLLVRLGRVTRLVPVLPIKYAKTWKAHLWEALAEVKGATTPVEMLAMAELGGDEAAQALQERTLALDDMTVDRTIDLMVEFDRENVLGGRDTIEELASPRDCKRALDAMKDECFPFADEMTLMNMIQLVAAKSAPPSSTNGHSPIGVLPLDHLKPRSPTASSASSGKRARSA